MRTMHSMVMFARSDNVQAVAAAGGVTLFWPSCRGPMRYHYDSKNLQVVAIKTHKCAAATSFFVCPLLPADACKNISSSLPSRKTPSPVCFPMI